MEIQKKNFDQKIQDLREAVKDNRFNDALREISKAFSIVDSEGWPEDIEEI